MPFAPAYVRAVLRENFEDAKTLFLAPLMAIHQAHLAMLAEQRILPATHARAIRAALDGVDPEAIRTAVYDGTCEDLFFYVERQIAAACGADAAGRLHTARSRNDIDMTMYRMRVREWVLDVSEAVITLRRALLDVAGRHVTTIFPAHTHTQPAQPTTVAHYFLGVLEELARHSSRLSAAYRAVNRCPLGACAITGTGFAIDRRRTSDLLGFDAPTGNTYGSIAAVDDLIDCTASVAGLMTGLGRVVQDLLLWCTAEMGYLSLADGFVQVSSIMPQKRNPVALEHARALASKAMVQAAAVPAMLHNTPFGDIVDTEDDLQPLVASAFKDASRALVLVGAALAGARFNVAHMRARATEGGVTLTELADHLAREHGLPFAHGHAIAAALARGRAADPSARPAALLSAAARDIAGREIQMTDDELAHVLSPEHFIEIRRTHGGPAPEIVQAAIDASRVALMGDEGTLKLLRAALSAAETRRRHAVDAL